MTDDRLLAMAARQHRSGNLRQARRLYLRILAQSPEHAAASFQLGLLRLQQGQFAAALCRIQKAIAADPKHLRYFLGLGQALTALGRWDEAAAAYRGALRIDPRSADAQFSLGLCLQSQGDWAAAIAPYAAAVALRPDLIDALNNLGTCHQQLGNLGEAEGAYRRVLALRPDDARAGSNLGSVLLAAGRIKDAIVQFRSAAAREPAAMQHAVNLGDALCRARNFSEAAAVLRNAQQLDSNSPEAAFNLGNALKGLCALRDAAEQYRKATSLRPDYADAWNNLGTVYKDLGEFKLAAQAFESAIAAKPNFVVALNNIGCLMRILGRHDEGESYLREAVAIDAEIPALHNNLGNVLKDSGALDEAIECFRRALALDRSDAVAHSNLAYALSFQSSEPEPILDECLRWNSLHAAGLQDSLPDQLPSQQQFGRRRSAAAKTRLRVGYVSPDFRDHCQSLFTIPLLSQHDHTALEVFCYSSVERPDDFTRRIAGYADVWREVRTLDDEALAERIRADGIDILVDLTMHMAHGRPLVFARKPAPVQVAWLAYPGTTGIGAIDFRLTDARLDPPGYEAHYSERTIRLPDSIWCYDPLTDQPPVNPLPVLSCGQPTLGCLNNACKLTDHTLRLWGAVMRALPDARLMLMAPQGQRRLRLLERLAEQSVANHRVTFVPYRPRAEYLLTYHQIDLGLDTFPYNGHTTSFDSLWMGVPVVTRVGRTCVGRAGLSQLFHLDLLDLAADSDEGFVAAAVTLASDLPRLANLRQQLRGRLERSPLMDAPRFARNIEAAFREMWG